jgi:hypothetical protein
LPAEGRDDLSVRLYQSLLDPSSGRPVYDTITAQYWVAVSHLYRGEYKQAAKVLTSDIVSIVPFHLVLIAQYGAVDSRSTDTIATGWLRSAELEQRHAAVAWFGWRRDTTALKSALVLLGSSAGGHSANPLEAIASSYIAGAARAYLSLARHDTTDASRRFATLPDTLCVWPCWPEVDVLNRLFAATGRASEAARLLDKHPPPGTSITAVTPLWIAERARVAALLGDTAVATRMRNELNRIWVTADSNVRSRIFGPRRPSK